MSLTLRLLECIEEGCSPSPEEARRLLELADLNKLRLALLRRVPRLREELAREEARFRRYMAGVREVAEALRGLDYALHKFRRPVDHVSVDVDVLVHRDHVAAAARRLARRGFRLIVAEPYTVTMEKGELIVDLYTHPSFAWIVYMDGEKLLREHAEEIEVAGAEARALTRGAEVAVAAAHAVYKEHIILLLDCLTIERWLSKEAVEVSAEARCEKALRLALSVCRSVRSGAIETPYKLPLPPLVALYVEKFSGDYVFRATSLSAVRRIASDKRLGKMIAGRLGRKSY